MFVVVYTWAICGRSRPISYRYKSASRPAMGFGRACHFTVPFADHLNDRHPRCYPKVDGFNYPKHSGQTSLASALGRF